MLYITNIFCRKFDNQIVMNIWDSSDDKEEEITLREYHEIEQKISQNELSNTFIFPPLFNYTSKTFVDTIKAEKYSIKLCDIQEKENDGFKVVKFYYDAMQYHNKLYSFDKRDNIDLELQNYPLYTFVYYKDILIFTSCTANISIYGVDIDDSHTLLYLCDYSYRYINHWFSDAMLLINKNSVYDLVTDVQHTAFSACPLGKASWVVNTIRHKEILYRQRKYKKKAIDWKVGLIANRNTNLSQTNTDIEVRHSALGILNYRANEEWTIISGFNYRKVQAENGEIKKVIYDGNLDDKNIVNKLILPSYIPRVQKAVEQAFKEFNKPLKYYTSMNSSLENYLENVLAIWLNYKLVDLLSELKDKLNHDVVQVKIYVQATYLNRINRSKTAQFNIGLMLDTLDYELGFVKNNDILDLCSIERKDICFLS